MTTPRKRLDDALAELRAAREEVERLLAESESPALDLNPSRSLRRGFAAAIEKDRLDRLEKKAEEMVKPSTADLFAEALEDAFRRTRGTATDDNPDEN